MWVQFVVSSCPCSEGFSPSSLRLVFLPSDKTNTSKLQFDLEKQWMRSHYVEMPLQISIYLARHDPTSMYVL